MDIVRAILQDPAQFNGSARSKVLTGLQRFGFPLRRGRLALFVLQDEKLCLRSLILLHRASYRLNRSFGSNRTEGSVRKMLVRLNRVSKASTPG